MKIDLKHAIDTSSTLEGFDMQLDDKSQDILIYILTQGYSEPIKSIVREYSTNALDAHIESDNLDEPFIVRISDDTFEVQDFGIGMDKERISNVFCKFLGSTKRDTNKIHGGFGLGAKSALSYSDYFTIYTVKDGYYHHLIMRKDVASIRLETIDEGRTTERNGTRISIPIKNGDYHLFIAAAKSQLAYMDNITFISKHDELPNDFNIHRGKHFSTSTLMGGSNHNPVVLLGNVAYPLDGSPAMRHWMYKWPIALNFNIGDLKVTPYREDIIYDDDTIEKIINKFQDAVAEIESYRDALGVKVYDNASEFYDAVQEKIRDRNDDFKAFGKVFTSLENTPITYSKFKVLNKAMTYHTLVASFKRRYKRIGVIDGHSERRTLYEYTSFVTDPLKEKCIFIENRNWSVTKNKYLVRTLKADVFLYQKVKYSLWKDFYNLLNLNTVPRKYWRQVIQEWLEFEKELVGEYYYDNVVVPESFKQQLKAERKQTDRFKGIRLYEARNTVNYGWKAVFDVKTSYGELLDKNKTQIYVLHHDEKLCNRLWKVFYANKRVKVAKVAPTNYEKIESSDKIIKYDDFMKVYSKHLSRIGTAMLIAEWLEKNEHSIRVVNESLPVINSNLSNEIVQLKDYVSKYHLSINRTYYSSVERSRNIPVLFKREFYELLEENNWWDRSIIDTFNKVKRVFPDYEVIKFTRLKDAGADTQESIKKFLGDYFKLKKLRINKSFYNIKTEQDHV